MKTTTDTMLPGLIFYPLYPPEGGLWVPDSELAFSFRISFTLHGLSLFLRRGNFVAQVLSLTGSGFAPESCLLFLNSCL